MNTTESREERDARCLHAWAGGWGDPPPERTLLRWLEAGLVEENDFGFTATAAAQTLMARFPQHGAAGGY
jgi:hypothetical protein